MDELLQFKTPHSAEAEQAVLGSMLIDSNCINDVLEKVRSEDFYIRANREIFDTIFGMHCAFETVDPVTVLDKLRVNGVLRDDSRKYLMELMQITPTAANVMKYAEILKEQTLLRELSAAGAYITNMVAEGEGEADEMLDAAERRVYALRQGRTIGGLLPIEGIVKDVYNQIGENSTKGTRLTGLPTGLTDLDNRILGLNKGDFILIASRPGMGKTSIALNIALNVAKNTDKTVVIFSLEMSREQLAIRFLSTQSQIDSQKLQTGKLSYDEWIALGKAAARIRETSILIDDNATLTVAEMNAQCRRVDNLGLVIIDYLQLMSSAGSGHTYSGESRTQAVSDMSRMLKVMAKELNVPVLCLSQLSRANESRQNKRPLLSDLRESGAIEQDADIVIGLYREGYYDRECDNPNEAEAIILKNRHGETATIRLMWRPEYTEYVSYTPQEDEY